MQPGYLRKGIIMKKLAAFILMTAMAVSLLATNAFAKKEVVEPDVLDFVTTTTVTTSGDFDFDLTFEVLSDSFKNHAAEHPGTDMVVRYTTDAYEDGVTYDKWCRVYLPYGYDPEDTETKYNVIYFQHGNNQNPNEFFDHATVDKVGYGDKNLFDNMMDPEYGVMNPCILVFPTYYFYAPEDRWNTPPNGDLKAGDGNDEVTPANYYREVVEDLIPAVEGQLNTYCEDFSEEGIIATRDHRMWSGYSRGSACTWYMFKNNIPYFAYFMPMSCPYMPAGLGAPENSDDTSYEMLKEAVEANADYDFFVFATAGGDNDGAGVMMVDQVKNFLAHEDCFFSYGMDPEANNFYFTRSAFDHDDCWMPFTLYNALPVIFEGALVREAGATTEAPAENAAAEAPAEAAAAEAPAEAAAAEAPEGYTQMEVFDGTYGFGDAEVTAFTNDDFTAFYLKWEAFDEDQVLEGTVEDGIVSVEYDETGFMSGDAQLIWDDAMAADAWEAIGGEAPAEAPEGYTKVKVFDGTYGFGDAEITVATNDDESAFCITFEAFDEDQVLEGTVEDGIVTVEYDETGFMTGDAQLIWDDAIASENAWETID